MINLYQFTPHWNLPNASPFCMKIETYLKLAKIPYEVKFVNDPGRGPKGKLPFIKDGNQSIPDSTFIIDYLKTKYNDSLDQHLTPQQKAQGTALQRLIEEHLYWCMVYFRWIDPAGWAIIKEAFFGTIPAFMKGFICTMVRNKIKKSLYFHGLGRHSAEEISQLGIEDIDAVAAQLGNQQFLFGDKPSSFDAVAYAFIANILYPPVESPLKKHIEKIPALKAYCERMGELIKK